MKKLLNKERRYKSLLKHNLKMKLSLLFIFSMVFMMQANTTFSQKKITLNLNDVTVNFLINEIESKTEYRFVYKLIDVDLNRKISISVIDQPISAVLTKVFEESSTAHNIIESQVFLIEKTTQNSKENDVNAKEKIQESIKGTITDENNNPLIGVSVYNKKTKRGVSTSLDGSFNIVASVDDVLVFSYLGYKTKEIVVNNQKIINLQMEVDATSLEEIVISTGIFKRKSSSFTGAAVTINKEQIKRAGNANLFQALKNIDPSIAIFDNFDLGSNPNALPEVQIRGASTFPQEDSNLGSSLKGNYIKDPNQPLFILNGFISSLEQIFDIDINRVESVTLLKDAASKAIYGARAANGVVVIETQKLSNEKALITYNSSMDLQVPDLTSYNLTNSLQKLEAEKIDGVYTPNLSQPEEYVRLQQLYNARKKLALEGLDTDWIAKPLETGIGQRHSLTAELGGDDLRILTNISVNDIKGVMKGSGRKNLAGNFTTFYRVKNLSFKNLTSITSNNSKDSPYGKFSEYVKMNPYWRAENIDGSIPYYAEINPDGTRFTNPLYNAGLNSKFESGYFNFINNFYLEWRITPELMATTRVGIDVKYSDADEFLPANHTSFDLFLGEENRKRKGSYQVNNGKSNFFSGDLNVNYNKQIDKHTIFTNLGFNISENTYSEFIHKAEGFPSNQQSNIIFAKDYALGTRPIGIEGVSRDIGFLAVGSYVYDNRFLSDITLRTSASSQFGSENRWAKFWSVGLGWNLHNEKFLSNTFDQFRIRGSVGSTGNQNFNSNESIATYSYYLESLYQGFTGSFIQNLANSALQWETKLDYNIGLDTKFKNLSVQFDYYESYTENLITDITVPTSTGFNRVKENLGKVKNSGIEANLSYLVWSKNNNFLSLNFGLATNKNEIIELSDALRSFNEAADQRAADRGNSKPVARYEDGMSLNTIWAVRSLGIDPSTGNEIYLDQDGNTTFNWEAENLVAAGQSTPTYRGTFGFNAEYKGFGLSLNGRFLGGGQLYNQTLVDRVENIDINYNVDIRVLEGRWRTPGQITSFKRLGDYLIQNDDNTVTAAPEKTRATTRFVQDRNEIDFSSLNVYYDFSGKTMLNNLGMKRLRFSLNVNELGKISSIEIERGREYPFARAMSFSVLASF